jgi:tyrosyl-tRNA synthetase
MLAGRILQERAGQRPQVVMTGPLIPGTNGEKMSSSVGNVIDLLDSPRDQYFSLMRMHDDIIVTYFETCTAVPLSTIRDIAEQLESDQLNPRDAKALLARTIVTQFHSAEAAHQAEQEFEQEVRRHEQPQNIPDVTVPAGERRLADFLREIGLVESRASARRLIEQGGVSVNGTRATLPQASITPEDGMLIRVGKSGWARLRLSTTPATATP